MVRKTPERSPGSMDYPDVNSFRSGRNARPMLRGQERKSAFWYAPEARLPRCHQRPCWISVRRYARSPACRRNGTRFVQRSDDGAGPDRILRTLVAPVTARATSVVAEYISDRITGNSPELGVNIEFLVMVVLEGLAAKVYLKAEGTKDSSLRLNTPVVGTLQTSWNKDRYSDI